MTTNTIGFPLMGFEITVNETAFTIFGLSVQWYGIILTVGIICGFIYFYRRTVKIDKIPENDILNIALFTIPIAIIGARFVYVITTLGNYDSFWDVINIRKGGIAVYGSIIFGILTMFVYCRIKKLPFLRILDAAAPAEMIGQIIGRWGNFMNGEAYGYSSNVENWPFRMTIVEKTYKDGVLTHTSNMITAHPTFLYESLWNLLGFILISIAYKHKKKDGQIVLQYLAWYGLGRGLIEFLRTDSLRGLFGEKLFVVIGLGSFVICSTLLVLLLKKAKKEENELKNYAKLYSAEEAENNTDNTGSDSNEDQTIEDVKEDGSDNDQDVSDGGTDNGECDDN
ncbi:MAG: prolipoprotein diacylglyceryl transferase [Clostridia bacterium]|nr:prolipoprotein diacylglyceryl transferase [Clostridia bacterium]